VYVDELGFSAASLSSSRRARQTWRRNKEREGLVEPGYTREGGGGGVLPLSSRDAFAVGTDRLFACSALFPSLLWFNGSSSIC
jgi:hypothetical protein